MITRRDVQVMRLYYTHKIPLRETNFYRSSHTVYLTCIPCTQVLQVSFTPSRSSVDRFHFSSLEVIQDYQLEAVSCLDMTQLLPELFLIPTYIDEVTFAGHSFGRTSFHYFDGASAS